MRQAIVMAVLVMVLAGSQVSTAVTCSLSELQACFPTISIPILPFQSPPPPPRSPPPSSLSPASPPSNLCCTKLSEQLSCICQFIKNPILGPFFTSRNFTATVGTLVGLPFPPAN
ncbi:hypothetical protein OSB04_014420 [Centaurea solstitialis]|uniref:Bifunctional inhibitor/plant lipid transfer protein/seed storage helical domain-containing protein n=1 Tax=Centaurea solstitialis TaxID=347529 RepID=A0AA38T927_9ASTR|nr:hypothetical protein OSB04_014420 [Centaurea solstitialis]